MFEKETIKVEQREDPQIRIKMAAVSVINSLLQEIFIVDLI